ncbi:hypothetical protein [Burkholderia ubonensis]|uniref:Uncharacterized protein n=1 Tax=Burkholderia ubonensis TaxID=101571 RepID=A0A107EV95_9BURK|nr:hypothetical protein [Burkholderia ubonensis]KWD81821.1 hypothetical protein WL70_17700 [Burkholderia ubonensis]KWD83781.1 hypothetical protein WL71_15805 [Burkholderia ubonensis]KWE04651.1 hypothetical protein WL72_01065 [Burkholderia ubonensis]KWE11026.1 hypothetical protein WL73_33315 [Burkholderia ubonensis]
MTALFYLQDSRSFVGNDVMWWADPDGYTTDLRKARLFTRGDAQQHHNTRETDILWPKEYIDAKTRPAVDVQYIRRDEALRGTGIVLQPKRKLPRAYTLNCSGCGRFVSDRQRYLENCRHCGADNRP